MNKKSLFKLAAVLLFAVLAAAISQYAQAATTAGDIITNTAHVNFNVLNVPQPEVTGSTSFVVDRKIDLLVTKKSDITTGPSATTPALVYLVTNNSNTTIRFGLTTQVSGTAQYVPTSISIWKDTDNSGTYTAGDTGYTDSTTFGDIASGASVTVLVTATTPGTATDLQTAGISLVAQAYEPTGSTLGAAGTAIAASIGANGINTVETVFADAAGSATSPADTQYDGKHSALAFFTVNASTVSVNKSSIVFSDGLGTPYPNAKAIPGATIEYTMVVKNSGGTATAQSVTLSDTLSPSTAIQPVTGTWSSTNGGSVSCTNQAVANVAGAGWACIGSWSGQTLTMTVGDLSSNATATILYRATVQ